MKKINLTELMVLPDFELLNIFETHDEYATPTLLFCYAEIKRRDIELSKAALDSINEVTERLKIDDFDNEVINAAKSRGFDNYEDLYNSIMNSNKGTTSQNEEPTSKVVISTSEKRGETSNERIQENQDEIRNTIKQSFYKVVPFPQTRDVSNELQGIINAESVRGWRYINHQYSDKLKPGSNGCFGIGATPDSTIHIGVVIFEKD